MFLLFAPLALVGQDFEVAPVRMLFSVEPGQVETKTLTITNHSSEPLSFMLLLGDYVKTIDGNIKNYEKGQLVKRSCADWITFDESFFEINPNAKRLVKVSMQPAGDDYSTRWANIFVQTAQEQTAVRADKLNAGMFIRPRIIVQVIQSPTTNQNHHVVLESLTRITQDTDSIERFNVTIWNDGDKLSRCKVYLLASNMQTMAEVDFPPKLVEVYPEGRLEMELQFDPKVLKPGKYALAAIVDFPNAETLQGKQLIITID